MFFCPICPVGKLDLIKDFSHHMVLAQLLNNKEYFNFYAKMARTPGKVVIMDNGAYEGSQLSDDQLLDLTLTLKPQVVVLPDLPHNMIMTWEKSTQFWEKLMDKDFRGYTMCVLHAPEGNIEQFCQLYLRATNRCEWIGFSRLTQKYGVEGECKKTRRVQMAQILKKKGLWRESKKHHALGMLEGDLKELRLLNEEGFESCDSSSPIWRGLNGWKLSDPLWPDVDFSLFEPADGFVELAKSNLIQAVAACEGKIKLPNIGRRRLVHES